MKDYIIVGLVGLMLTLSAAALVYGFVGESKRAWLIDEDGMDEMHSLMVRNIADSDLRESMDETNEDCERLHEQSGYGSMMGMVIS